MCLSCVFFFESYFGFASCCSASVAGRRLMGVDEEAAPIPEATGSNGAADDYFDYMDDAIPTAYGYEGKWCRSVVIFCSFHQVVYCLCSCNT